MFFFGSFDFGIEVTKFGYLVWQFSPTQPCDRCSCILRFADYSCVFFLLLLEIETNKKHLNYILGIKAIIKMISVFGMTAKLPSFENDKVISYQSKVSSNLNLIFLKIYYVLLLMRISYRFCYFFISFAVFQVDNNATPETLTDVMDWFQQGSNVAVSNHIIIILSV